jgi:hypothetical protein
MTCTQMKYFGLALGVILAVPAAESATQTRTRGENSARCYRVSVSSPERPTTRRRRPSFSAAEIMDIQLQAYVSRRMAGHHSLELKVYTPNGNLYQSMTLPFDADAPAPNEGDRMARRFQEVSAVLPVAGTSIVSSSMYGTWKVEAYLDDNERACSSPTKFVIEP